jgi:hypothetical protein
MDAPGVSKACDGTELITSAELRQSEAHVPPV